MQILKEKIYRGTKCRIARSEGKLIPFVGNSSIKPFFTTEKGWVAQTLVGEYPYDSSVVLFWVLDGQANIRDYHTEINPGGSLKINRDLEKIAFQLLSSPVEYKPIVE